MKWMPAAPRPPPSPPSVFSSFSSTPGHVWLTANLRWRQGGGGERGGKTGGEAWSQKAQSEIKLNELDGVGRSIAGYRWHRWNWFTCRRQDLRNHTTFEKPLALRRNTSSIMIIFYDNFNFFFLSWTRPDTALETVHDTESQKQSIVSGFCWLYFLLTLLTFTSIICKSEIDTGWFVFKIEKISLCSFPI